MLTDYLGHDLFVGDECVYLRRKRTEQHTYITDLEKGVIVEICEDFVVIQDPDGIRPDYTADPKRVVRVMF